MDTLRSVPDNSHSSYLIQLTQTIPTAHRSRRHISAVTRHSRVLTTSHLSHTRSRSNATTVGTPSSSDGSTRTTWQRKKPIATSKGHWRSSAERCLLVRTVTTSTSY